MPCSRFCFLFFFFFCNNRYWLRECWSLNTGQNDWFFFFHSRHGLSLLYGLLATVLNSQSVKFIPSFFFFEIVVILFSIRSHDFHINFVFFSGTGQFWEERSVHYIERKNNNSIIHSKNMSEFDLIMKCEHDTFFFVLIIRNNRNHMQTTLWFKFQHKLYTLSINMELSFLLQPMHGSMEPKKKEVKKLISGSHSGDVRQFSLIDNKNSTDLWKQEAFISSNHKLI